MAIVSLLPAVWTNADALRVKFPGSATTLARGGAYPMTNGGNMVEVYIDLASLPTAASGDEQIVLENCVIPSGAFIEKVEVLVTAEPTTVGSPNLDLGFVKKNSSTGALEELDYNGLLAAADAFEAGTDIGVLVTYDTATTEAGALVGTALAADGTLSASPDTADWTAGQIRVRVFYSMMRSADVTA
jgi:hypothetical protein